MRVFQLSAAFLVCSALATVAEAQQGAAAVRGRVLDEQNAALPGSEHWNSQNDPEWQTLAAWVRAGAAPVAAQASSAATASFDFAFYRTRVEPIFLKPRRQDEGSGSACVVCHAAVATRMRLQPLSPGATSWTEEQSRKNFEVVSRLVTPGEPLKSPLLVHSLAPEAGGSPTLHGGGKVWTSQDNPEWQTLAAWVRTGTAAAGASASSSTAAVSLDFEFFRTRVQPIFLARRGEHARCVSCHRGGQSPRLQPLSPGATTWNEEQSRKNFEELKRLVAPGDPLASRLLTKPLAVAAGGDPFHIGSKHWASQNDPEWQTLADWVRTGSAASGAATAASAAAASLDFEFYRTRVEPIFLKPRRPDEGSGNACVVCHAAVATRMRLQALSPGATSWTVEQSRQNFAAVSRLVTAGEPLKSPLLLHALDPTAGGSPTLHGGGKVFTSQDNPEWQTLAAWVRTGKAAAGTSAASSAATVSLDFEFFKVNVQPIFLARRGEHARCVSCHRGGQSPRLQPLSPGATTWDEEQSRKNFEELKRLVAPGDPLASRLLTKPLAVAAGGDPFHIGSKHFASQNDPEWQTLSAWVRGQTVSSAR